MKKTIFYSWQSDLASNTNRGFIEDSLEKAIKGINRLEVHLDVAIDRDTQHSSGTPDIVNTLFEKIDRCQVFVADVSLINTEGKRTPNPNVLLELGYAAKCVGWANIICIYNTEYGQPEELPFDLRFRRPLQYKVSKAGPKAAERNLLAAALQKSLQAVLDKQHSKDVIYENIKLQVDQHLMAIANLGYKLFYGYKGFITPRDLFNLVDLTEQELSELLSADDFMGFQLFKNTESLQDSFQAIVNNPIFAKHIDDDKVAALIKLGNALYLLNENLANRRELFRKTEKTVSGFRTIEGTAVEAGNKPGKFLLLKTIDQEKGVVMDSGDFTRYRQADLLTFFKVAEGQVFVLVLLFKEVFSAVGAVINQWGGSIMLDPARI